MLFCVLERERIRPLPVDMEKRLFRLIVMVERGGEGVLLAT